MMLSPLEFIYKYDSVVFIKEDSLEKQYFDLVPFSLLIYDYDNNNNEIIKGSADCYLNQFNLVSYDHFIDDMFVIDVGYTFDEDDEDRIVWESLELFYYTLFCKIHYIRDIFIEDYLIVQENETFVYLFSEFEVFFKQINIYIYLFILISLVNRLFFLFL